MLGHEEHMERFSALATESGQDVGGRELLRDNMSMIVSDALRCYSPFVEGEHVHPDEWYVVGVMMYALDETSHKKLPVDLISLGTFVKRVCELGPGATLERILNVADLFSVGLFRHGGDDAVRIAEVLHDYILVAFGDSHEDR